MMRLLVLVLIVYLAYLGLQTLMGRLRGAVGDGRTFRPDPPPHQVTVTVHRDRDEELVTCARCGVRVPRSRTAAGEDGEVVCSTCRPA